MSLKMNLEVAFCCKTVATNVALERTFTSMRPDVDLQRRVAAENFPTISTPVSHHSFFRLVVTDVGDLARSSTRLFINKFFDALLRTSCVVL